jgi:hypothetical protein
MKSKTVLGCLAGILVLAVSPSAAWAQYAGFQIGIAQGQFGFPAPQPPAVSVYGTFTSRPTFFVPVQTIAQTPFIPNFPTMIVPNNTMIVPNQVFIPGQTIYPWPVVNPAPVGYPYPSPVGYPYPLPAGYYPPTAYQPIVPFVPVQQVRPGLPVVGTPRADVIRQFGAPSVTIITSAGETMHFSGGVTVIIQNGQVAGPR